MLEQLEDQIKREIDEKGIVDVDRDGFLRKGDKSSESPINPETGQPVTRLKPTRWFGWYHSNHKRLLAERNAMMTRFPDFNLVETSKGLTWTGYLKPKGLYSYRIALIYPEDFPYSPPNVWIIEPKIKSPKHQRFDGHLCLLYTSDNTWQTNTTAVTIVAMTATWIWCYEYHQKYCGCSIVPCDYWPGKEC